MSLGSRFVVGAALILATLGLPSSLVSASGLRIISSSAGASAVAGEVLAWGENSAGESSVPPEARSGVTAIAAGGAHSLALKDGGVIAWGDNLEGQTSVPTSARSDVIAIAAGNLHSLALTRSGEVIAWGDNGDGQVSVPPEARSGVTAIAAGAYHSLAVKDGAVLAWGNNGSGQVTVPPEARRGVTAVAAGWAQSLALIDESVLGWGWDDFGQASVPPAAQQGITAISSGYTHSLGLNNLGQVIDWGIINWTQTAGVPIEAQAGVSAIAAGYQHSLALRDGKVIAWGDDRAGQVAVPPSAQIGVTAIAAGGAHSLAIKPPSTVPSPPRSVLATAGDGKALVSWLEPATTGGTAITGYTAISAPGGRTCSTLGLLTCEVDGLENGTSYTFRVTAFNAVGASEPSQPSGEVTPRPLISRPGVVTNPKVTPIRSAIRVSWSKPGVGDGSPALSYQYRVGSRPWMSTVSTSVTVRGKSGVRITVRVRAVNEAGPGPLVSVSAAPR